MYNLSKDITKISLEILKQFAAWTNYVHLNLLYLSR